MCTNWILPFVSTNLRAKAKKCIIVWATDCQNHNKSVKSEWIDTLMDDLLETDDTVAKHGHRMLSQRNSNDFLVGR